MGSWRYYFLVKGHDAPGCHDIRAMFLNNTNVVYGNSIIPTQTTVIKNKFKFSSYVYGNSEGIGCNVIYD